jgi:hypothetical protein
MREYENQWGMLRREREVLGKVQRNMNCKDNYRATGSRPLYLTIKVLDDIRSMVAPSVKELM